MLTIGISGFGRIGRYLTRLICSQNLPIRIGVINARADNASLAHLLQYDSSQGTYPLPVRYNEQGILVNDTHIPVTRYPLSEPNWNAYPIDILVETTGKAKNKEALVAHHTAGAPKILVTAPSKDVDVTIVYGVNTSELQKNPTYISAASCTTNCLAPVAKVLHESFSIVSGTLTTVHSYTMSQRILDGTHKDLRRARAAALSMIPTTTGAAQAVGLVLPALQGKLSGMAIRVPTPTGSLIDFTALLEKHTSVDDINEAFASAAKATLCDVLGYSTAPLVSCDYVGTTFAAVVDALSTKVVPTNDGTLAQILAWYDNEASFTNQVLRILLEIAKF